MKHLVFAAALAATISLPAQATDVGVSVSIGQPGFYGRLDIGNFPQPQLIYSQPRVIGVIPMERPPIYLRVPPGHSRHWDKHCREYDACGERVYFVQDDWYTREYAPRYREQQREGRDHGGNDHQGNHKDNHKSGGGNGKH